MVILITTPFFSNLGGSELETVNTANLVAEIQTVKQVIVFSPNAIDLRFLEDIYLNKKVVFKSYPNWLQKIRFHKAYKKLKRDFSNRKDLIAFLFWKFFFITDIHAIYILSKSSTDYFYPIIKSYRKKNKILIKYTTIFYEPISPYRKNLLESVKINLVTSQKQSTFFKNILKIKNVDTQEILIRKEDYALKNTCNLRSFDFDFGIISRISREKQIEDAIDLILILRRKGFKKSLIIRGEGDQNYIDELKSKILKNNLGEQVIIEQFNIHPDLIIKEFSRFQCFLITSKFEGGPNIGLELMAFGKPMISYKVGAMEDRLENFPELLASDTEDLVEKSLKVLNATPEEYNTLCKKLQNKYIERHRNIFKEKKIIEYLGLKTFD